MVGCCFAVVDVHCVVPLFSVVCLNLHAEIDEHVLVELSQPLIVRFFEACNVTIYSPGRNFGAKGTNFGSNIQLFELNLKA